MNQPFDFNSACDTNLRFLELYGKPLGPINLAARLPGMCFHGSIPTRLQASSFQGRKRIAMTRMPAKLSIPLV